MFSLYFVILQIEIFILKKKKKVGISSILIIFAQLNELNLTIYECVL